MDKDPDIFVIFQGGGVYPPPPPSGSAHVKNGEICVHHLKAVQWNAVDKLVKRSWVDPDVGKGAGGLDPPEKSQI